MASKILQESACRIMITELQGMLQNYAWNCMQYYDYRVA
jgi:hypothetical protein